MYKLSLFKKHFPLIASGLLSMALATPPTALAAATPYTAPAENTSDCIPSKQQVSSFFTEWNDALKKKNLDGVVALYANNAVLLPTVSDMPRSNHTAIRAYFIDFLKKNPEATLDKSVVKTGCNWASNTGLYTFQLLDGEGKPVTVQARYSYVYEKIDGKWLIISHHSSFMPEGGAKKENI